MSIQFQSLQEFAKEGLRKQEGVYKIIFPNGMIYLGQSVDVLFRLQQHLWALHVGSGGGIKWYTEAAKANKLAFLPIYEIINQLKIEIYPCNNSLEIEGLLLKEIGEKMEQSKYYNKQYFSPRLRNKNRGVKDIVF